MAHVLLSGDEERQLSDDHVGRSPFQLLTVKKVVVGFAVVAAFLCGAAVLAPAKSTPNANLSDSIIIKQEAPTPAEAPEAGQTVLHLIKSCELCKVTWCGEGMDVIPRNVASFSGYVMGAHLDSSDYGCDKLPPQPKTVNIAGALYVVGYGDQAPAYKYRGCFEDTRSRTLKEHPLTTGATPATCHAVCSKSPAKFAFFGLQAASHCFCGNDIKLAANKSESECNMACHSEPSTTCGGQWRNSIYEIVYEGN